MSDGSRRSPHESVSSSDWNAPALLQSFSGVGDDLPLALTRSWAEATARLIVQAREQRRRFANLENAYERSDVDGLTWDYVEEVQRTVWSTECLLILSASNLETWMRKLYEIRRRGAPPRIALLKQLRNSIEHLHEANIDETTWTATPANAYSERRGIGALPDGKFDVWSGPLVYVPEDEIESLAKGLLDELATELDDYVRDWIELVNSGR